MKLNDYISQLCGLCARQVRANRAAERLYDRDFRGRISTHPRAGTVATHSSRKAKVIYFNSPPRGDVTSDVIALSFVMLISTHPHAGTRGAGGGIYFAAGQL